MKNNFLFLFAAILFSSCSKDDNTGQQETAKEDYVTVGVSLGGELTVRESPLKTGAEASTKTADGDASTDLFGIQIFDAVNDVPYAFVLGDDISKINFELKKGWEYDLEMTYIKDGQNLIGKMSNYDKGWQVPFYTGSFEPTLNEVFYGTSNELKFLSDGEVKIVNTYDRRYVPIERFNGNIENFTVLEASDVIDLNLKRTVFGITLEIDLGTKNKIEQVLFDFSDTSHATEYLIDLENGKGFLELPLLTLGGDMKQAMEENYEEDIELVLGTEDQELRFFFETLQIKRNTMHHISFTADINDGSSVESTMGNVKFSLEETGMSDVYVNFSQEE